MKSVHNDLKSQLLLIFLVSAIIMCTLTIGVSRLSYWLNLIANFPSVWLVSGLILLPVGLIISAVRYDATVTLLFCFITISYGGGVGPFEILLFVLLLVGLLQGKLVLSSLSRAPSLLIIIYCLIILHIISILLSTDRFTSVLFSFVYFGRVLFIIFVAMYIRNNDDLHHMLKGYYFSCILSLYIGLIIKWGGLPQTTEVYKVIGIENGRIIGFAGDPNVLGPFYIFPLLFSLMGRSTLFSYRPKILWDFVLITLPCVLAILLTASRAAIINLIIAIAIIVVYEIFNKRLNKQIVVTVATGILVALVIFPFGSKVTVFSSFDIQRLFDVDSNFYFDLERLSNQQAALNEILNYPLGVGAGMSVAYLAFKPHNTYLTTALEIGWVGLILMIVLLVSLHYYLFRMTNKSTLSVVCNKDTLIIIFACLAGYTANALFIDILTWRGFSLIVGIAWAFIIHDKFQYRTNIHNNLQKFNSSAKWMKKRNEKMNGRLATPKSLLT